MEEKRKRFRGKTVVITGSAHGIGKAAARAFEREGAVVLGIDIKPGQYFTGDIARKEVLEEFAHKVIGEYGHIDYLINNAAPLMKGIRDCTYEDFEYALKVGVTAPFYLTRLFQYSFNEGGCVINISSSRDRMSEPQTESYSAAKGGIAALTHAMANSLAGKVRVNSISPGWIDTEYRTCSGPDADQQLVKRVGNPDDIANAILFLCSEEASFIDGENLCIDGGMTHTMIYHGDNGWKLEE